MSYILFSTTLNRPLARVDANPAEAVAEVGELIFPCVAAAEAVTKAVVSHQQTLELQVKAADTVDKVQAITVSYA